MRGAGAPRPSHGRRLERIASAIGVLGVAVFVAATPSTAAGNLAATDLNTAGTTAQSLVSAIVGSGVTTSNVTYTGSNCSAGTFSGGDGILPFASGIVLGSGSVQSGDSQCDGQKGVEGPNSEDGSTGSNQTPGDTDLSNLVSGVLTNDAAVLEFDFVPATTTLTFNYVFSSDEYNEFVNSTYNDVFGFFVNGTNCALVPGTSTPVAVNTVNGGNPFGTSATNSQYFVNNDPNDPGPATVNTEMDGLTTKFTCSATVTAGQTNHIKLAIADTSDTSLDSNVFIEAGSFSGTPVTTTTTTTTASGCKPGYGYGDKNHCHGGPPGRAR